MSQGPSLPRQPFHRSRERPGGGSGLGLAIGRGFVEANGGRIRAESLPGQGASFVLQFPAPADAAAAVRPAEGGAPREPGHERSLDGGRRTERPPASAAPAAPKRSVERPAG